MAASIQIEVSSTAPAVITESMQRLLQVRDLWTRSQKDQLEIGRLLYEEQRERLGNGGRGNRDGFHQWLREAGIPKTSAYRRIAEYEVSISERTEDDAAYKPVPNGTTITVQPTAAQPWMRTLSDQAFFDVLAALQGEIRRGMEKEATQHAMQLEGTKAHRTAVWNRLEVICAEDVGLANVDAVARIQELRKAYNNAHATNNPNQPATLFLVLAVSYLCRSPKSRIIDNLIHITKAEALLAPTINTDDVVVPPLEKTAIPEWVNSKGHMADGAEFFHDFKAHLENCTLDDPYALRAKELDIALEKTAAPKTWTHADEKRTNRSEPLASEDAVVTLALKVIDAGYKALKDSEDPSHLHAAVRLAKLSLTPDEVLQ